ncbi:GAF domain-containing sensor histidine kinase [Azospirillum doebereinerae]|uniref:histidine kinase n=1 Tax=Azospirillum doebereinerae TaxID=92933 RepID=A0A433J1D1_9PROT|nr:GAF domain-containing sensor histidine kinase [Azospirillum doebereinerae]RUQ64016.1 GAF domain-containing sensor histidine kinase [Azospirillum doebereinerae]
MTTRSIADDISAIGRISAVPAMLQVICETTGLRFAAVARVTGSSWTACAVLDQIGLGLKVGGELDLVSTLCHEIHASHEPIVIDNVSEDTKYCNHHTPKIYGFQSYISVPVFQKDGSFFGTICALDPLPAHLSEPKVPAMLTSFAKLLAMQLEAEEGFERTEAALLDARQTAELREQFIAVLGHDLRNPLFGITSGAEYLLRRPLDATVAKVVDRMLASGRRALRLVDDVLDFARGRLGHGIPLDVRDCHDLTATLGQVVSELRSAHPGRTIRSTIGPVDGIRCDGDRIAQLLSNLVANALTHGAADGAVEVVAQQQGGVFTLSVTNQGRPIPADVIPRLFQPYWRPASDTPQDGLGLGLYITGEIARSHGGRMEVASSPDGTTFTFTLPPGATVS